MPYGNSPPVLQSRDVEVSSAEILALFTTPVELVPAPGANLVLEFHSIMLAYDWNSAAYVIGGAGSMSVYYTNLAGVEVSRPVTAGGTLDQVADWVRWLGHEINGHLITPNAPLVLALTGANVTNGDSPIHAKVAYMVHQTRL